MRRIALRTTAHRLETTFAGRCAREFIALRGIDRAVVLASQALTALIPLLLLVSAAAPADHGDGVSRALISRFHLEGDAADAVQQLFAQSGSSAVGVFSGFLLLFSGVSLTRRMQRMSCGREVSSWDGWSAHCCRWRSWWRCHRCRSSLSSFCC